MPVYMVSYDIPEKNESYSKIKELLEKQLKAQSVLESQWLLVHDGDSGKIINILKPHIQQGDRLLVQKVTDDITDENLLLTKDELKNLFDKAEKKEQDRADEATAGLMGQSDE